MGHVKRDTRLSAAKDAAEALRDLNVLDLIHGICDGSTLSTDCNVGVIIAACKREKALALERYDAALALVETRKH